ncbi:hypothetical protein [Algoriphagus namhaensis]
MTSPLRKGLASIFIFTLMALLPLSCGITCNDPCGCGPSFEVKDFRITDMEALTLVGQGQQVTPSGTYPYDQVVKGIRIKSFQTVAEASTPKSYGIPGLAYACSPETPKSVEKMTNVQLISLRAMTLPNGKQIKIGDDLSEYFEMNYYFTEGTLPISEFLEGGLTMFSDDLYKLAWTLAPTEELKLTFTIRVQLESGREFLLTDQVLNVV